MSLTLLLVTLVTFAFAAGHWLTRYASRVVALGGAEYILVGLLLGPHMPWTLLSAEAIARLHPLIYLLLGLAGFTLGLRARRAASSADLALGAVVACLGVFGASTGVFLFVLSRWMPGSAGTGFYLQQPLLRFGSKVLEIWVSSDQLWVAVGLGAAATVASSSAIRSLRRQRYAAGKVSDLVTSCANVSEMVGVVALGLLLASTRASGSTTGASLTIVEWSVSTVALGVVCGVLFGLFIGRESDSPRLFLATVGLVTFASGVGSALGVSPLFTNLLAGITVSMMSPHSQSLMNELQRLNHPLFVLLMIFAGTMWSPVTGVLWWMPVAYVVTRALALRIFLRFADRVVLAQPTFALRLGNSLLGQGSLAVAIGVNLALRGSEHADIVLSTVLIGVLCSDLFSLRCLRSVLADAGELSSELPETGPLASDPEAAPMTERPVAPGGNSQ